VAFQPEDLRVSGESLKCASVIPSLECVSSREAGWSSLLVDHHIGSRSDDPYWSVATPDFAIGVATSGRYASEVRAGGRWRRGVYHAGAVCLHQPDEMKEVRFEAIPGVRSTTALIYLPRNHLVLAAEHLRRPGARAVVGPFAHGVDRDPAIFQMALSLLNAMEHGVDDFYAQTAAAWLAVHLMTRHGSMTSSNGDKRTETLTDARLARVLDFMAAHMREPLTLERIASEACISKFHFSRVFQKKTGQSPYRYLTSLRLEAACRLLLSSDLSIGEVGLACGYPLSPHFTTAFTARYGVTPSAFRMQRTGG